MEVIAQIWHDWPSVFSARFAVLLDASEILFLSNRSIKLRTILSIKDFVTLYSFNTTCVCNKCKLQSQLVETIFLFFFDKKTARSLLMIKQQVVVDYKYKLHYLLNHG